MNYTNNLKDLRKKAGYTQEELAKKIGISKRTLAYWEKGENSIKADKAEQLAKLFGVSIGVLLGYRNENDSLGFRLWSLRNQKGIELEKAASDLKLSIDELKLIEQTDNAELGDALAKDFAKYYNVSVSYLMGYSDKKEPYYSDEILLDNGSGGVSSLSFERHNDLQKEYSKQIRKDFINFLRSYDFVISDNEIKVLLEQISNLNISTLAHIDHERVIKQTNPKKYLIENGYKELGDLFQSNKGIENFYKEKGYDPESTL
ncbi:putative transcriptional regulator [Streptococcus infantarius subsp. infantarius]|nr:putative transcriptional regulator [Streptococcus infantarius subsp. infantarius]MCO4501593.1 putative transcriptional regulator [Streptococcus infantarius subsp. infantarius]